ncbi:hypothetical protein BLNAU_8040 [Blattamonas nauphoetae]|uniref:Uncharacterized protein n=1 Tax=Blattamonas nauphoetae TaxID=2049346 RepID=A0ABQ9XZR5_9EUKA|nr:hypothetical protein BLNAU_8040 [Blattamonas nauphoetae]
MLVDRTSSQPQIDNSKAKQTNLVEVFLTHVCGECKPLRPRMLKDLLVLATESDWALSAILEVDYIQPLEEYCEQTQPCEVTMALNALSIRSETDSATRNFLRTLKVPSGSTDSSSELVPFVGRLCSTLAEHVSELKSLFTESSASDGTVSALSTTLPSESPLLNGIAFLEMLCDELSLLDSLLFDMDNTFGNILIKCNLVPLLKSTIIACLDLLERQKSDSNHPPTGRTDLMIDILDWSWDCAASCLWDSRKPLTRIAESTFSDVPQLCSLLERTCGHSSPTHFSHLRMIIHVSITLPRLVSRLLEENLVERVIDTSKPMTVPIQHGQYHLTFVRVIVNLIWDPKNITQNTEEQKRIRKLQFEQVMTPAKEYLQFILQREEFIREDDSFSNDLPTTVDDLLVKTLVLEREIFEDGEIVETGREEWEVGWLVEKTKEDDLGERLKKIRGDNGRMKKNEKARWKKRVERRREAGYEDAMEGWLTRRDNQTRFQILVYVREVRMESGMNNTQ